MEARHLTADEVSRLLKAADGSRYYPVLVLIANTGLRKGEALGLSWDCVDLDGGVIKVTATLARVDGALMCSEPKTQRSRRTVPLTPAMVTMLRKHRAVQAAEQLRAVNQWQNSGLVFTNELGGPTDPRNILRVIETAATRAGLSGVGAHTLRHWLRWHGWSQACTSARWPICSATAASASRETSTATAATTEPGLQCRLSARG